MDEKEEASITVSSLILSKPVIQRRKK